MIVFDQLRISDNGQRMYIDIHVNQADYFDNVYLDSITIVPADKVLESYGDSGTDPTVIATDYIYHLDFEDGLKEAHLMLTKASFDEAFAKLGKSSATIVFEPSLFSTTLFFVYVKCKVSGVPDPCIPCDLSNETSLGVVFDPTAFYQNVMGYTRELADNCEIPKNFIDFILNFNAFKAAVETEHYIPAIKFYNQMFGRFGSTSTFKGCGCRG